MKREMLRVAGIAIVAGGVAGCQMTAGSGPGTPGATGYQAAASGSPTGWNMPQPLTEAPRAPAEETTAYISGLGYVRGAPQVLATLPAPLEPEPGRNRTVEACRDVVERTAASLGAVKVEVVSGGPDRRVKGGAYQAPIQTRIIYPGSRALEVRQATLTCTVDARGKVISANV